MVSGVRHVRAVVDPLLVHGVEAEQPLVGQRGVHMGDTGGEPLEPGAVMDRVQEAGDQVDRPIQAEAAHVLQQRASGQRSVARSSIG